MPAQSANREAVRLQEAGAPNTPWRQWGPYISERQWGTVRKQHPRSSMPIWPLFFGAPTPPCSVNGTVDSF